MPVLGGIDWTACWPRRPQPHRRRAGSERRSADQYPCVGHARRADADDRAGRRRSPTWGRGQGLARRDPCVSRQLCSGPAPLPWGWCCLFRAQPMVAAGVMVVAVCPGALYGPPFTGIAKGDVPRAVGLMVLLAGSSALLAPLLLQLLLPLVTPGGQRGPTPARDRQDAGPGPVSAAVRRPWGCGVSRPPWRDGSSGPCRNSARCWAWPSSQSSSSAQFRLLSVIRPRGYAGMLALLAASAAAGWLLGGAAPRSARRSRSPPRSQRGRRPGDRRREFPRHPRRHLHDRVRDLSDGVGRACRAGARTACRCDAVTPRAGQNRRRNNAEHAAVVTHMTSIRGSGGFMARKTNPSAPESGRPAPAAPGMALRDP